MILQQNLPAGQKGGDDATWSYAAEMQHTAIMLTAAFQMLDKKQMYGGRNEVRSLFLTTETQRAKHLKSKINK